MTKEITPEATPKQFSTGGILDGIEQAVEPTTPVSGGEEKKTASLAEKGELVKIPTGLTHDILYQFMTAAPAGSEGLNRMKRSSEEINHHISMEIIHVENEGADREARGKETVRLEYKREPDASHPEQDLCIVMDAFENQLKSKGRTAKMFLTLFFIEANKKGLFGPDHANDETPKIEFPLQDAVDLGMYTKPSDALVGFRKAVSELSRIRMYGIKAYRGKKAPTEVIEDIGVPLLWGRREGEAGGKNTVCTVWFGGQTTLKLLQGTFTLLPTYYFRLNTDAAELLRYTVSRARQDWKQLCSKKYIDIKIKTLCSKLGLPSVEEVRNPSKHIWKRITDAIDQIEIENAKCDGEGIRFLTGTKDTSGNMVPLEKQTRIANIIKDGWVRITFSPQYVDTLTDRQLGILGSQIAREEKQAAKKKREKAKALKAIKEKNEK